MVKAAVAYIIPVAKRTAFDAIGRAIEGVIDDACAALGGVRPGKVRLLNGVAGRDGAGFGLLHIEAKAPRMKQFSALGFATAHAYVAHVLESPTMIACQTDGRLAIIREHGVHFHYVICEWDETLSIWSVTTAIPKRHARDIVPFWRKVDD